jgi:hypothetical protein
MKIVHCISLIALYMGRRWPTLLLWRFPTIYKGENATKLFSAAGAE